MSSIYTPLKIFIATPNDLIPERKSLLNIAAELNSVKAHSCGYHLEVLGWENTVPGSGRPQSIINKEIEVCDLFIMALWERWGTPTGDYSSGTEEEYYVALQQNNNSSKPKLWLFFKETNNQLSEDHPISCFRNMIEAEQNIFYKKFEDVSDWENKLRIYIAKWIDTLNQTNKQKIDHNVTTKSVSFTNILYKISYSDYIITGGNTKPAIYFTIKDKNSLTIWKQMKRKEKKQYIYDLLSNNLGLILGANPYLATIRYQLSEEDFLLLGTISRKYEDSLEESRIFIPDDYCQLCEKSTSDISFNGFI